MKEAKTSASVEKRRGGDIDDELCRTVSHLIFSFQKNYNPNGIVRKLSRTKWNVASPIYNYFERAQ